MANIQGRNPSFIEKTVNWFKGIDDEPPVNKRARAVEGQKYLLSENTQGGKRLKDRDVAEWDKGLSIVTAHGNIRKAQSLTELDYLQNKYNNDSSLTLANLKALQDALDLRRSELESTATRQ